jgi:hypothetical protein
MEEQLDHICILAARDILSSSSEENEIELLRPHQGSEGVPVVAVMLQHAGHAFQAFS